MDSDRDRASALQPSEKGALSNTTENCVPKKTDTSLIQIFNCFMVTFPIFQVTLKSYNERTGKVIY